MRCLHDDEISIRKYAVNNNFIFDVIALVAIFHVCKKLSIRVKESIDFKRICPPMYFEYHTFML